MFLLQLASRALSFFMELLHSAGPNSFITSHINVRFWSLCFFAATKTTGVMKTTV